MKNVNDGLRAALAEWDRLANAHAVMKLEGINFGAILTLRGHAMEALIHEVRKTLEKPPMMTVGELRERLGCIPDHTWVCVNEGPVNHVIHEPGAGEPFIVLEYVP